jgi:hypothetical protein
MENDDETPKRSKRQRTAKSFGDDFIVYLVDDTPSSISEAYHLQMLITGRKLSVVRWIPSWLMELGRLSIVLTGVNL